MDRGESSGPCPRCKGPTEVVDYDEAPWGARGNYSFSCKTCGMFGERAQDPANPTPVEYIFYNDQANVRLRAELLTRVAAMSDEQISEFWERLKRIADESPFEVQFSDKTYQMPVDVVVSLMPGFEPGKLVTHQFTSVKDRAKLPAGATVLSEMTPRVAAKLPARTTDVCLPDSAQDAPKELVLLDQVIHDAKFVATPKGTTAEVKRCNRCGRLEATCDSGLYGDCIDYRRQ